MSAEIRFHRSRRRLLIFLAAIILATIAGVALAFTAPAAASAGTVDGAFTPFSHAALESALASRTGEDSAMSFPDTTNGSSAWGIR